METLNFLQQPENIDNIPVLFELMLIFFESKIYKKKQNERMWSNRKPRYIFK